MLVRAINLLRSLDGDTLPGETVEIHDEEHAQNLIALGAAEAVGPAPTDGVDTKPARAVKKAQ